MELEAFYQKRRSKIYKEENKVGNVLGKGIINGMELTGFFRIFSKVTGRAPYKCCECGFCAEWNASGEIC